jgi:hypothetical protein
MALPNQPSSLKQQTASSANNKMAEKKIVVERRKLLISSAGMSEKLIMAKSDAMPTSTPEMTFRVFFFIFLGIILNPRVRSGH